MPKIDVVKAVTKNLMNAIENVNVGLMRFTGSAGGRVLHAVSPIDTDRTAILNKIDALVDGGATPLAETLYESALYWRGLNADYGNLQLDANGDPTGDIDPKAFVGEAPGTYQSPAMPVCTRNFNVLLTDGVPVDDADDQAKVPLLTRFRHHSYRMQRHRGRRPLPRRCRRVPVQGRHQRHDGRGTGRHNPYHWF